MQRLPSQTERLWTSVTSLVYIIKISSVKHYWRLGTLLPLPCVLTHTMTLQIPSKYSRCCGDFSFAVIFQHLNFRPILDLAVVLLVNFFPLDPLFHVTLFQLGKASDLDSTVRPQFLTSFSLLCSAVGFILLPNNQ